MRPEVSIILPAYNEEENLETVVKSVLKECRKLNFEIVIVDDCSSDSTGEIADRLSKKYSKIKVVHRTGRNSFGMAIRTGFKNATGKILVTFMCDRQDDAKTIPYLIKKIHEGYDIAVASRFTVGGRVIGYPIIKYIANRLFNKLVSTIFGLNTNDVSNAFKAYRRNMITGLNLKSEWFEITPEIVLKAVIKKKVKIGEVPTTMLWRKKGKSKFKLFWEGLRFGRIFLEGLRIKFFGG
jgi:glycosyltransferase involved in cell wall biosynthesis